MKVSTIKKYLSLHSLTGSENVTFRDLSQLADDDVSSPEHVEERSLAQDEIVSARESEVAVQLAGARPFVPNTVEPIDYNKLAAAIAEHMGTTTEKVAG